MKKKFVLKDNETGRYFTDDYKCWWSRDIKDAYLADSDSEFLKIMCEMKDNGR